MTHGRKPSVTPAQPLLVCDPRVQAVRNPHPAWARLWPTGGSRTSDQGLRALPLAPFADHPIGVDGSDEDVRAVDTAATAVGDAGVQVGDHLADRRLGPTARNRLRDLGDLLAEQQWAGQYAGDVLPLDQSLDPPVLVLATIQSLDRLAFAGQVVELTTLGRLSDLSVDPGLEACHRLPPIPRTDRRSQHPPRSQPLTATSDQAT